MVMFDSLICQVSSDVKGEKGKVKQTEKYELRDNRQVTRSWSNNGVN